MYLLKILICKVKLFQEVKFYYNHLPWPAPLALWDSFCPQGLPRLLGAPLVLRGRFVSWKLTHLIADDCPWTPVAFWCSLGPRGLPWPSGAPFSSPTPSPMDPQQQRRGTAAVAAAVAARKTEMPVLPAWGGGGDGSSPMASICLKSKTRQDNKTTSWQDDKTASEKHGSMSCAVIAAAQLKKWVWFGSGLLSDWPAYSICVCSINLASKTLRLQQKLAPFSKSSSMAKRDQDWSPTSLLGHTRIPGQKSNKCLFFWVSSEKAGNS